MSILDDVILNNTNFKDNMSPYSDVNSFHLRKVDCSQSSIFSFSGAHHTTRSLHPYYNVESTLSHFTLISATLGLSVSQEIDCFLQTEKAKQKVNYVKVGFLSLL